MKGTSRRTVRTVAALAGFAVLVTGLWWGTAGTLTAVREGPPTFDGLLAASAALVAWALVGWVVVIAVVTALAAGSGRLGRAASQCANRVAPVAVQRLVRVILGLATAAIPLTAVAPAGATTDLAVPSAPAKSATCDADLDARLPSIGRPAVAPPRGYDAPPHNRPRSREEDPADVSEPPPERPSVVVEPGDTLWSIAIRHLGADPEPAEVSREWHRWYVANREAIGPDPDLIRPGLRLRPPA